MAISLLPRDPLLVKTQWDKAHRGGVPFYRSSALAVMPQLEHGFTTRIGGSSCGPYKSMNLGLHVGDAPDHVFENRHRVARALGFSPSEIATAEQVHGSKVARVTEAGPMAAGVDALITNTPNILLMLMFADCVPIYIFDPLNKAVGLVHSGWKGTDANIVQKTVEAMVETFGTVPSKCIAAVGPCIGFERYEVSLDVAKRFRDCTIGSDSGSAQIVVPFNEINGTYHLNLRQVVFRQLIANGFKIESVFVSDQCTFSNKKDFYSHRRDGAERGTTGRMAAVIGLKPSIYSRGNR
jgi:YfiH family protein